VARPDISTQVRFRKQEEIEKGAAKLRADGFTRRDVKMLTSCPSCLQGLSRYNDDAATSSRTTSWSRWPSISARRRLDGEIR
jgi:Fe-S oxidoreductase